MEIERIEINGKRELKRLGHNKPEGIADKQSTIYKCRAMNASHGRLIYRHVCEICKSEFEGIKTARFCSNACRQVNKRRQTTNKDTVS